MVSAPGVGRDQLASQRLELPAGAAARSGKACGPACQPAATVARQASALQKAQASPQRRAPQQAPVAALQLPQPPPGLLIQGQAGWELVACSTPAPVARPAVVPAVALETPCTFPSPKKVKLPGHAYVSVPETLRRAGLTTWAPLCACNPQHFAHRHCSNSMCSLPAHLVTRAACRSQLPASFHLE